MLSVHELVDYVTLGRVNSGGEDVPVESDLCGVLIRVSMFPSSLSSVGKILFVRRCPTQDGMYEWIRYSAHPAVRVCIQTILEVGFQIITVL